MYYWNYMRPAWCVTQREAGPRSHPPHPHPLLGYYLIQYPIHLKKTRITACYCFKNDHLKWHNKQGLSQLTVQGAASVRCCRVCLYACCAAIPPTLYCTCHVPPWRQAAPCRPLGCHGNGRPEEEEDAERRRRGSQSDAALLNWWQQAKLLTCGRSQCPCGC